MTENDVILVENDVIFGHFWTLSASGQGKTGVFLTSFARNCQKMTIFKPISSPILFGSILSCMSEDMVA